MNKTTSIKLNLDFSADEAGSNSSKSARPFSRRGKKCLSYWMDADKRRELDIIWRKRGFDQTQEGMDEMVDFYMNTMRSLEAKE